MIEDLYNHSFNIYSVDITGKNTYGGINTVIVLRQSAIPCYFTYLKGGEGYGLKYGGKEQVIATHRLFCSKLYIKTTDIIYIPHKNLWYEVTGINNCNNMANHYEVAVKSYESPQCLNLRYGWTWGYQYPVGTTEEEWTTWNYKESIQEATNTGAWGLLKLTGLKQFVSPVKDSGSNASKTITLSYDNYGTGIHNCNRIIWWRASNTLFGQSEDQVTGPVWNLYVGAFSTGFRYLQVKVSIYP